VSVALSSKVLLFDLRFLLFTLPAFPAPEVKELELTSNGDEDDILIVDDGVLAVVAVFHDSAPMDK
jgi:sulfur transfer complex TusBCD TusB component (DsrH family)